MKHKIMTISIDTEINKIQYSSKDKILNKVNIEGTAL